LLIEWPLSRAGELDRAANERRRTS